MVRRSTKLVTGFLCVLLIGVPLIVEAKESDRCPQSFADILKAAKQKVFGDSKKLRAAEQRLEIEIAKNLANPPTKPIRILNAGEVRVTPMDGGKAFKYSFMEYDPFSWPRFKAPKEAIGREVRFIASSGREHKIEVIGSKMRPEVLDFMVDRVLKLPADVLEATEQIEVQSFRAIETAVGIALKKEMVLYANGLNDRTLRHEFGHNLAGLIWGRYRPHKEWQNAVLQDGPNFVTKYAQRSFASTGYTEDFAEAVEAYIADVDGFRRAFPNRAALLDTVFRGGGRLQSESPLASGGIWFPLKNEYNRPLSILARQLADRPVVAVVASGAGGLSLGLLYTSHADAKPPSKASTNSK